MESVLLQLNTPGGVGGRPKLSGSYDFDLTKGIAGYFLGYDPEGRKILIRTGDLQNFLQSVATLRKENRGLIVKVLQKILSENIKKNLVLGV